MAALKTYDYVFIDAFVLNAFACASWSAASARPDTHKRKRACLGDDRSLSGDIEAVAATIRDGSAIAVVEAETGELQ